MNEEISKQEKVTLLKRLTTKLHTAKIAQKVTGLVLSIATALTIVSCQPNNSNNTNNNNDNDITIGDNTNNEFSEYSDLLQNILTDEYYTDLVDRAINEDSKLFKSGYFAALPYSFLEDEGFDINSIKNNQVENGVNSYIFEDEPNALYIDLQIETKSSTPYYSQYILKYTLTEQEAEEYHMLHTGKYIQAPLMNQVISDIKTPTIISKTKITKDAYSKLITNLKKHDLTKTLLNNQELGSVTLMSIDKDNGKFYVQLLPTLSLTNMYSTSKTIATATLSNGPMVVDTNADGAFYKPCEWGHFLFKKSLNTEPGKQATIYDPFDFAWNETLNYSKD